MVVVIRNEKPMEVYRVSAVTFRIMDMRRSCSFYSRLPGFTLIYGGASSTFTTFEVGKGGKMYLNLELIGKSEGRAVQGHDTRNKGEFGRVIFHTKDVDALYHFMRGDRSISQTATIENEPLDASWGERFFHVREPDGYQLSFAQPITKEARL